LFGNRPSRVPRREIKKIVFASPHSIIDYSNGAAIATLHALQFLGKQGFECQSFCGSYLDTPDESRLEEQLDLCRIPYESRLAKIGDFKGRMIFSLAEGLPVTSFGAASTLGRWSGEEEIAAFLTAFCMFLDKNRPDAVLTYGGDAVAMAMIEQVKVRDIPVVFMLHNFLYTHPAPFALVDYATVPSEFCRRHYWDTLKLACHRLPNVVDWRRIEVAEREPRYVTFVNPHRVKGVFVFARIAEVLSRRRPDIPLLIVEGRGKTSLLEQMGLDLGGLSNLHRLEITPDPRNFYRISKLILMPSLWNESFGLVAAEAMISGIPVLASNRGALPETLGNAGFLFDIPPQYTPETQTVPSEEEIEPWVKTIIRLWDDALFYEQASQAARAEAKRWHPDHIAPIYRDFFANLFHQPAPPIMPKDFILSAD
jgi:glycosyltransferase involved in cell wall biosynthesis